MVQLEIKTLFQGIQFLITEEIMTIPPTESGSGSSQPIPAWIKNNAGWWADGSIGDKDFVSGHSIFNH